MVTRIFITFFWKWMLFSKAGMFPKVRHQILMGYCSDKSVWKSRQRLDANEVDKYAIKENIMMPTGEVQMGHPDK